MAGSFDRKAYMREYEKNKRTPRKIAFTKEEDEIIGRYLAHKGQGWTELVKNLILEDMHKENWTELIKPPKKSE